MLNNQRLDSSKGYTVIERTEAPINPQKSIRARLIGQPLRSIDLPHQTVGKLVGLAVFASDALSSVARAAS